MGDHLHVVTGGPGAGKTSLVEAVARRGIATVAEAGRAVIREEAACGGTALPWADRAAFARRMLARDVAGHRRATALPGPVLFDRGIPDVIGWLDLCGLPVPAEAMRAARTLRYNRRVFLAPFVPEWFTQDAERRQDPVEAAETCRVMAATYAGLGYEVVKLPVAGIAARVDLVLRALGGASAGAQPRAAR